ncbi:hypothetical protein FOL47_008801 [Perkinsus chesapeaki]|uniref:Uncharacterized protein n=1 Tax=Perkinsus chesapeaki TaxID=330153 RepID=A0A7J6LBY9_PERCH|nr:hypothetical protein FOL47_008801 [Perkinsus chesapeaki]
MMSKVDHPLSEKGRQQAEKLRKNLASLSEAKQGWAEKLRSPGVLFCSPLTRAVQTAAIALKDIYLAEEHHPIVLLPSAREKKSVLGFDSVGAEVGPEILKKVHREMRNLYGRSGSMLDAFEKKLRFDVEEVAKRWWSRVVDTEEDIHSRLEEFMSQLISVPEDALVVVGHSHFFRDVFAKYMSQEYKSEQPGWTYELTRKVLPNCGVAMVTLNLVEGVINEPHITQVDLLFGAKLVLSGSTSSDCGQQQQQQGSKKRGRGGGRSDKTTQRNAKRKKQQNDVKSSSSSDNGADRNVFDGAAAMAEERTKHAPTTNNYTSM